MISFDTSLKLHKSIEMLTNKKINDSIFIHLMFGEMCNNLRCKGLGLLIIIFIKLSKANFNILNA
jgi:hypothetical protein